MTIYEAYGRKGARNAKGYYTEELYCGTFFPALLAALIKAVLFGSWDSITAAITKETP